MIEKYKNEIEVLKEKKQKPSDKVNKLWKEYLSGNQLKSYTVGSHLLNTLWGQQNGFNDSVPNNYYAGCTAVAMAQILRYWECRLNPTGQLTWTYNGLESYANFGATTYWWSNMSNRISEPNNAQLIYHAGVSCKTEYSSGGSSSTPGKARDGFVDYWGISSSADVKWRISHLNTWEDDLKDELDLERPILYSGSALLDGGHSWVLEGYNNQDEFYCNWGWYGNYNGWYSLGSFDPPEDNGPYNQYESAIFNVYPEQAVGVETPQLPNQTFDYSSNGYNLTISETFGATSYEWITNKGTISGSGTSVILYADCSATIQVRAFNAQCGIYSPYDSALIEINYGIISGHDIVCSSNTYYVSHLPPGSTVEWSLIPNTSPIYLQENIPGTNQCLVSNPYRYPAVMTLTADINTVCGANTTITKTIASDSNTSYPSGSYSQPSCSAYNYTFPSQSGTLDGSSIWLYPGCMTEVTLSFMVGRTVTLAPGSGQPLFWTYQSSNNRLYLQLPNNSGGIPFVFYITGDGACTATMTLVFFAYSGYSLLLSPNPTSGESMVIIEASMNDVQMLKSASTKNSLDENTEWDLEVYDDLQNLKLKKDKLKGKSTNIQSASWKEGVYLVRVKYKDHILTGKLVVKK